MIGTKLELVQETHNMTTDFNFCFIRQKLASIKTASMLNMGDQPLKLPNDIITLIHADDAGQLWFTCHKPRGVIINYDQSFPAKLFFYQKGISYYLEAKGLAFIAGHDEIREYEKDMSAGTVLLKMTPSYIEYTESKPKSQGYIAKWYSSLKSLFSPVYHLSK